MLTTAKCHHSERVRGDTNQGEKDFSTRISLYVKLLNLLLGKSKKENS